MDITASSIRKQLDKSVGYYEERDLQSLKVQSKMQTTKAKTLAAKLKSCSPGRENWELYQDICKDILSFCLVPPLSPAFEQVETKDRIHKRDLIFSIPHELGGFWTYLTNRFGLALIFECKNYSSLLRENNLIISQKYVGKRKLTRLGIIITRRGLHKNAEKAQENLWKEHENMLLCLSDENLTMMLQLKDDHDEPWKVIDNAIRGFLMSLS